MAGKLARAKSRATTALKENKVLRKGISAAKRAAKNEVVQIVGVTAAAGTAGAVVGAKVQAHYLDTTRDNYNADSIMVKGIMGKVPVPTAIGLGLVALAVTQLPKASMGQAALAGFGGGLAGGAFYVGVAEETP